MHDPMGVAHEIKYPWPERWFSKHHRDKKDSWSWRYHGSFITIWHKDPEADGTDDSCDWFWRKFTAKQQAWLDDIIDNPHDNIRHYLKGKSEYDMKHLVYIIAAYTRRGFIKRPWWQVSKWHFWHWRLQVHPLQQFKRHVIARCATCGGRFKKGQSAAAGAGKEIHHTHCYMQRHIAQVATEE
jgi:hypothetical protein